jgi:hypothetical protein
LIDRSQLKNVEDFDVYESLIRGHSLYTPPILVDTTESEQKGENVLEFNFDKPLSLFCLGLEIHFDAQVSELKQIGPKMAKKQSQAKSNSSKDKVANGNSSEAKLGVSK